LKRKNGKIAKTIEELSLKHNGHPSQYRSFRINPTDSFFEKLETGDIMRLDRILAKTTDPPQSMSKIYKAVNSMDNKLEHVYETDLRLSVSNVLKKLETNIKKRKITTPEQIKTITDRVIETGKQINLLITEYRKKHAK